MVLSVLTRVDAKNRIIPACDGDFAKEPEGELPARLS